MTSSKIDNKKYIDRTIEQENRTFFGSPVRYTTIEFHPRKLNYKEFTNYLHSMEIQESLQTGERYIEDWFELFLAYHEIELHHISETEYRNQCIEFNVNNIIEVDKISAEDFKWNQ